MIFPPLRVTLQDALWLADSDPAANRVTGALPRSQSSFSSSLPADLADGKLQFRSGEELRWKGEQEIAATTCKRILVSH
ncbi:hypothetical protein PAHAL_6G183300 [Panicum hallii]|uniref:Uncharacterized protein n=1 Tax=Panicum hallii TaxID=206008 RepID=A0A2S3I2Y4_9POAL|nr:hypothetical protein PAHAL_6G183300 [Panicum hallii]